MNKLASIVSLFLLAQIAVAGHHESGHMKKSVVIGYEISDEGEKARYSCWRSIPGKNLG